MLKKEKKRPTPGSVGNCLRHVSRDSEQGDVPGAPIPGMRPTSLLRTLSKTVVPALKLVGAFAAVPAGTTGAAFFGALLAAAVAAGSDRTIRYISLSM